MSGQKWRCRDRWPAVHRSKYWWRSSLQTHREERLRSMTSEKNPAKYTHCERPLETCFGTQTVKYIFHLKGLLCYRSRGKCSWCMGRNLVKLSSEFRSYLDWFKVVHLDWMLLMNETHQCDHLGWSLNKSEHNLNIILLLEEKNTQKHT